MNPGDALAAWRLERQMSQQEAGLKIGVTQGAWGAWEAGLKRPGLTNALAIQELTEGAITAAMWPRAPRRRPLRRVVRPRPPQAKSA